MKDDQQYQPHHATISALDLGDTESFYAIFGFKPCLYWHAPDKSLQIVHLIHPSGYIIELFCYAKNASLPPQSLDIGNDLEVPGMKHFALRVSDVGDAHRTLSGQVDGDNITEICQGRTGIMYFFVRDPNGVWVEIVQDDRSLDPGAPVHRT